MFVLSLSDGRTYADVPMLGTADRQGVNSITSKTVGEIFAENPSINASDDRPLHTPSTITM